MPGVPSCRNAVLEGTIQAYLKGNRYTPLNILIREEGNDREGGGNPIKVFCRVRTAGPSAGGLRASTVLSKPKKEEGTQEK